MLRSGGSSFLRYERPYAPVARTSELWAPTWRAVSRQTGQPAPPERYGIFGRSAPPWAAGGAATNANGNSRELAPSTGPP